MNNLIIYFDENYIIDDFSNSSLEVLFSSSLDHTPSKKVEDINLLIDSNPSEIRDIVWDLYNRDTINHLQNTFYSKKKWIDKNIELAIKFSRFNFGLSFNSDIANLVKIISIIYWSKKKDVEKIYFFGFESNWQKPFVYLLKHLDSKADVSFLRTKKNKFFNKNDFNYLRGLASIIFYSFKFLRKIFYRSNYKTNNKVDYIFFDYFFMSNNNIKSQYWGNLPEVLSKKYKIEIWHFFGASGNNSTILEAANIINELNKKNNKKNIHHRLIDFELGFKDLFPSMIKFLIVFIYFITKKFKSTLFPLIKKDYQTSFFSGDLLKSFLLHSFFIRSLPKDLSKTTIIYVGENQPWEKSLADVAIQKNCQKSIFSIQTSLRYWDMRMYKPYITSLKSLNKNYSQSFPSLFACNSKFSFNQMSIRFPLNFLKIVENFRFNVDPSQINYEINKQTKPYILFVGEYSEKKTREIFNLIKNSLIIKERYKIIFRPHPSDNSHFYNENENKFNNFDKDLINIDNSNTIVIGDSISTFLLEAFLTGQRVLAFHSKCTLNLSPFYNAPYSPPFFSSVNELNNLILNLNKNHQSIDKEYVDELVEAKTTNYDKWLQILNRV